MSRSQRGSELLRDIIPQPLTSQHIEDVAKLHYRLLSWSFNGHFGQQHMIELYRALLRSPNFFGYVYYRDGALIGAVTATTDFAETRSHVLTVYMRKVAQTVRILLRHPGFLLTALESKFLVPLVFRHFGTRAEWLTFITDTSKSYISPLVAMKMIDTVRDHFKAAGIDAYMAQGVKNNPRAVKLYEKLRWRVAARLPIHNIYHYPVDRDGPGVHSSEASTTQEGGN